MWLKKFLNKIIDFVYPRKCYLCNKIIIKPDEFLCNYCSKNLKINTKIRVLNHENNIICISPFEYFGNIRNSIRRFKFHNYKYYSEFFAKIIANELQKINIKNFDYICCVPLTKSRQNIRGFNQAELLAKDISKILHIPCLNALRKIKNTKTQHELKLSERTVNVLGAFDINSDLNIQNKNILLCDDIVTSGSTLLECVKILLNHNANSVTCCTIARSGN